MKGIDNVTLSIILVWLALMFGLYTWAMIYHVSPPAAGGSIAIGVLGGVLALIARFKSNGGS